tara:strand:- start:745 stop:906 length:162 start_codon:yes stop_codon:yes gene_type:complete
MKVGDLVRFKYFRDEVGVVIEVMNNGNIHVVRMDGAKLLHREQEAFEVINAGR